MEAGQTDSCLRCRLDIFLNGGWTHVLDAGWIFVGDEARQLFEIEGRQVFGI